MLVRAVQLHGFRNLAPFVLEPSPFFNVLSGDNGQGKTNLLEAIYLVGTLRSFRTQQAQEMIAWGGQEARVAARVARGGLERIYEVRLAPRRRQAKLDGKTPRSLGEYFGDFNVVLFAPEDLRVPRGSPAGRRRFLDRSVFNRDVTFLETAQRYARVLRSRGALLRDGSRSLPELLDAYDDQLVSYGVRIVESRRRYLAEIAPRLAQAYEAITRSGIQVTARYVVSHDEDAHPTLAEALAASRGRDVARRQTHVGPHVDDLELLLDERPAKAFASQGQVRALVLAWKTAEMRLLAEVHGDAPVLLLDDVSSELDPRRNEFLFDFLGDLACQCFVTTTHAGHVPVSKNRQDFQVVEGKIRP